MEQKINIQSSSVQHSKSQTIFRGQKGCKISIKVPHLFKKQTSKLQACTYFLLNTAAVLLALAIQYYFSQSKQDILIKIIFQLKSTQTPIYYCLYGFLIFAKLLLLLSVGMEIIFKLKVFGLSAIAKSFVQYATVYISLDLALTSFMTVIDWKLNIGLLIISALFNIMQALYFQNYIFRKDCLYSSSSYDYLLFRSIILLHYFGSVIFFILKREKDFLMFQCFIGAVHFGWFLKKGDNLFIHRNPQTIFLILNSLFFTVYIAFVERLFISTSIFSLRQILKFVLIFTTLVLVLYIRSRRIFSQLSNKDSPPKTIDILIRRSLQMEGSDTELSSELIGMIQMHQLTGCLECSTLKTKETIYDPFLKVQIKSKDFFVQKQTVLLYYAKELYQEQITKGERDRIVEDHIDYCEFLCNEHSDYHLVLKLLNQIRYRNLNQLQKRKIQDLEQLIQAQNQKLNETLYNGSLQIEHIIEAEQNFARIESEINQYVAHSLIIWKTLGGSQKIRQSELRNALKWDFITFNSIETHWKKIAKFMDTNKAWRFIYTHYQLFIRNERLKQKDFDKMGSQKENDSLLSRVLYFDEKEKEEKLINPAIMFDKNSGCISAVYEEGQLIVSRLNNRFSLITGYSQQEIIGSRIQTLMTPDLLSIHDEKFKIWLREGRISNEISHKIHFTSLLRKDGQQLSAIKYFKAHYHPESGLEFVTLFKFNIKPNLEELSKTIHGSLLVDCTTFTEQYSEGNNYKHRSEVKSSIFSKEEFLQPKQTFKQVQCFGFMSRIFTIVIISSIIILSLVIQTDSTNLNGYANQFMTVMIMYRSPIMLLTSYLKSFLGLGQIVAIKSNVVMVTNLLLSISASQAAKKTLFDLSLNPKTTYYPYYKYPFLANDSLSSIDLYNTIISSVISLSTNLSNSAINQTSHEFQRYNSYMKPAYDTMMNTTKFKLHQAFTGILSQSITIQLSFVIGQVAFFLVFLVLLFYLIQSFTTKMENIIDILLNFTPSQIRDIRQYWKGVQRNFDHLFRILPGSKKQANKQVAIEAKSIDLDESSNQPDFSANKRLNNEDQKRKSYRIKLQFFTIIGLVIVLGLAVLTQALMIEQFHKLQQFQADGFYLLKYFPSGPILGLGCVEAYYSRFYPSEVSYNPQRYEDSLFATQNFGFKYNYVAGIFDSPYFIKKKNYFFESPCQYAPDILTKYNTSPFASLTCVTICNGTLKQGLSSFMRYASDYGPRCINNQVNYTATQVNDFTQANLILAYYMFDVMETWTSEFTQKAQQVQSSNLNSCLIVMGVAIIIHLVINENMVFRKLENEYTFVKRVYMNMIPEGILIKEKVLRQKFVIEGIIKP